ncbi:hypothetical protein [Marivirga harenae]|uniref:hypothetical protein n=1 Tax=Marivirga harenae TaxID=2010992 RepID=UPI0026E08FBE|nr:hypothetical protein [Marivirga harenae]WKV11728.1 hypothetical protein Q3Y49_16120 [Marivirga harenae]|tara:strand:- start:226234 stop:226458 length:225 start_codon:yes stop_codon:yes gene_type:complete
MITKQYNPSQLEVEMAKAIKELAREIEGKLSQFKIVDIEDNIKADNPMVRIKITDTDNDPHEIVLKIIQKPDQV